MQGCLIFVLLLALIAWIAGNIGDIGKFILLLVVLGSSTSLIYTAGQWVRRKLLARTQSGRLKLDREAQQRRDHMKRIVEESGFQDGAWKVAVSKLFADAALEMSHLTQLRDLSGFVAIDSTFKTLMVGSFSKSLVTLSRAIPTNLLISVTKDYDSKTVATTTGSSNSLFLGNLGAGLTQLRTNVNTNITAGYLSIIVADPEAPLIVLSMNSTEDTELWFARIQALIVRANV